MKKKVLITGIFGQDGSYLAEILYKKGYEIFGVINNTLSKNSQNIKNYLDKKNILYKIINTDLQNYQETKQAILSISPDEIYHLAATHVSSENTYDNVIYAEKELFDNNIKTIHNILAICQEYLQDSKVLFAGSCLMFDDSQTKNQNDSTPYNSKSLYGLSKITATNLINYYKANGLFCVSAILYSHESSRRKDNFVTKKIIKNLISVKNGDINTFKLGNINMTKDWGYAKDYAYGMYLMLQIDIPKNYILSSGIQYKIRDFISIAAKKLELNNWENYVLIDNNIITRNIKTLLVGDSSLAYKELKWKHTLTLEEMIELMINNEFKNMLE